MMLRSKSFLLTNPRKKRSRMDLDWEPDSEEKAKLVCLNTNSESSLRRSIRCVTEAHVIDDDLNCDIQIVYQSTTNSPRKKTAYSESDVTNICESSKFPLKEASIGTLCGELNSIHPSSTSQSSSNAKTAKVTKDSNLSQLSNADDDNQHASIQSLSDEVLLVIFSFLPPQVVAARVRFVCKSWCRLSFDIALWSVMDFSFAPLKPQMVTKLVKAYCRKTTTVIAFKGPSKRPPTTFERRKPGPTLVNKCLTTFILSNIKRLSPSLTSFSLSHEQLTRLSLFSYLPVSITRLSLPFCNLTDKNFLDLIKDCPFKQLRHLDLSSAILTCVTGYSDMISNESLYLTLPTTLQSLSLDDFDGLDILKFASKQPNLTNLSMSYNRINPDTLLDWFAKLKNLQSLHLRGCLLSPKYHEMHDGDFEDWEATWSQSFPNLKRLDVRNVTLTSGYAPTCLKQLDLYSHLIDVDGTVVGDWTPESLARNCREDKYDPAERARAENRERHQGYCYQRARNFWEYDSSEEDDSDNADEDYQDDGHHFRLYRRRDICSLM